MQTYEEMISQRHCLAIDPGPTTGFAICRGDQFDTWQVQFSSDRCPHMQLDVILRGLSFDVLIIEPFEFRKDKDRGKIDYTAAEYVGVCKARAQHEGVEVVLQSSSLIHGGAFWSDGKKLRNLGLWNPQATPHGMDALKHLMYYLTFTLKQSHWFERLKSTA